MQRRTLLQNGLVATSALITTQAIATNAIAQAPKKEEDDVSPTEDLMREHGLVLRIVGVYQEAIRRIELPSAGASNVVMPAAMLVESAQIVRSFVEDYHEKLEEEFVFPRCAKISPALAELVKVLKAQHDAGRKLTDVVLKATDASLTQSESRTKTLVALKGFVREYLPHMGREDTVIFPALHKSMNEKEFDQLGDDFEKREQQLFGKDGFEKMVDKVAAIEKQLGIDNLAMFTPT